MHNAAFVGSLPVDRYAVFTVIIILYLILGCFLEGTAITILTIPIIFPVIKALGFNPVWFGIIFTITMEAGLITPPVGMNVFVLTGVAKDVPLYTIFAGIWPFLVAMVVCILLLVFLPQIVLILPGFMKVA